MIEFAIVNSVCSREKNIAIFSEWIQIIDNYYTILLLKIKETTWSCLHFYIIQSSEMKLAMVREVVYKNF